MKVHPRFHHDLFHAPFGSRVAMLLTTMLVALVSVLPVAHAEVEPSDALTPVLWREGRAYPATGPAQLQLIADGEVDLAISFSPGEATAAIANNQLPPSVRTFVLDKGTIGNASFVAVPYNSGSTEGAMVVANFLMSPEAQARAQDPNVLGYGTVLDMDALSEDDRALFDALDLGIATLSPAELGSIQAEPHPSWMTRIADDWAARYGVAQ